MSPKSVELIQQAEDLSAEEQLKVIAHLAQNIECDRAGKSKTSLAR